MSVRIGIVTTLLAALAVACGSAPSDEAAQSTEGEMKGCGIDCPDPPPPPPPTRVCSWNPLTTYPQRGVMPPNETGSASVVSCISTAATDAISNEERWLMKQGCSSPVFWQATYLSVGGGTAQAWAQLCPYTSAIDDSIASMRGPDPNNPYIYMDSRGVMADTWSPPSETDGPPHTSWTFSDANMPPPPWGYYWVIPWECPQGCSSGGCSVKKI